MTVKPARKTQDIVSSLVESPTQLSNAVDDIQRLPSEPVRSVSSFVESLTSNTEDEIQRSHIELLLFEVRSQCGYGFSFDQLEVSGEFYSFFDRSPREMTKKKPKFGALPKLNMPTKSYERGKPYTTS